MQRKKGKSEGKAPSNEPETVAENDDIKRSSRQRSFKAGLGSLARSLCLYGGGEVTA
ncbi:hypothetical protein MKW92_036260 [Papaver armeniacum]|nr:hypothetical protein MKW92_036260 [Papaver armeniacum]